MKQIELTSESLKDFLRHIITNNKQLQDNNKHPLAVEVVGESGIGKTSSIIQLADELELQHVKLNLAQIEELGDLVGFPCEEFQVRRVNEAGEVHEGWLAKKLLDDAKDRGYVTTGKKRMGYAAPEWISGKGEGGILILDDWNRADRQIIQAISC